MKVDPNTIAPELWAAEEGSIRVFTLACGRRFTYSLPPLGTQRVVPEGIAPESYTGAGEIVHPLMIDITPCPCAVHFGKVMRGEHHWTRLNVGFVGLSNTAAQAALAEAYRGLTYSRLNHESMRLEWKTDVQAFRDYKGGTPWRNVNICLQWDRWERNGVPMPERVDQLRTMGFSITEKALARYVEKHGL